MIILWTIISGWYAHCHCHCCRSPCLIGSCETPLEVMLSQMAASMPIPHPVLQAFLLPGAMTTRNLRMSFHNNKPYEFPEWDSLVQQYGMDQFHGQGAEMNYRLEVSLVCIGGMAACVSWVLIVRGGGAGDGWLILCGGWGGVRLVQARENGPFGDDVDRMGAI